jgi:hypothetical protein
MPGRLSVRVALAVAAAASVAIPLAAVGPAAASASPAPPPAPVVLVSGLNNPRQLSLGSNGTLFIAEAGNGGTFKASSPELGTQYIGPSGSISAVSDPATGSNETPNRVATGFLSAASQNGQDATGSDGVAASINSKAVFVQETFFGSLPSFFGDQSGNLYHVTLKTGSPAAVANISAYEAAHDPDGQGVASDPYAVLRLANRLLVADAAGNDVLQVNSAGTVSLFHVFPNITTGVCAKRFDPTPAFPGCNFVPDALATDGAGHIFVAGLASLARGQGQVVEFNSNGTKVLATYSGFTSPDGLAIGRDGSIYVSQLTAPSGGQAPGLVTRIFGARRTTVAVPLPSGLAIDAAGNLYVSTFSIAPAAGLGVPGADTSGQVWRLAPGTL